MASLGWLSEMLETQEIRSQHVPHHLHKPTPSPFLLAFGDENNTPPPASTKLFNGHIAPMMIAASLTQENALRIP
jgi:hypothetical protein